MRTAYKAQADFDSFISGKSGHGKTRQAVIYDQFGPINETAVTVEGTREEILAQYDFFNTCHPGRSLGLVCPEYFNLLREDRK
ncbi:MAG: hypothetical protein J6X07_06745 [Prevotella sp.]|nr:hypothetical protein [Prevotella sp.]